MYIAGRSRTASRPSRTLILRESYSCTAPIPTSLVAISDVSFFTNNRSDAHRHHDIPIDGTGLLTARPQLARAVRILEPEDDLLLRDGAQEIHQVLGVEANFCRLAVVLRRYALLAFTGFGNRGVNLDFTKTELNTNRTRAFIRELRHSLDRRPEFIPLQRYGIGLILRQNAFEVREIAGQLPRQEHSITQFEEQVIVVARKVNRRVLSRIASELHDFAHRFSWKESAIRSRYAWQLHRILNYGQPVPVRGNHRDTARLKYQKRSVQGEAGLLTRYRKDGPRDHLRQNSRRQVRKHFRHLRKLGKALARHAGNSRSRAAAQETRPLIISQL